MLSIETGVPTPTSSPSSGEQSDNEGNSWLPSIGDWFSSLGNRILQGLEVLGQTITDGIANVLKFLFIPSDDYFDNKINPIKDKFAFVNDIIDTIDIISDFFNSTDFDEAPSIRINLGSANSKYNYGGSTSAIDLSWYADYKPSVDLIMSSILWVFFIWQVFIKLPGIISGTPMGPMIGGTTYNHRIEMKR